MHFCGLFGPLSKRNFHHEVTTIVGNRGQLWTSTLSPHLLSPHLDFPEIGRLKVSILERNLKSFSIFWGPSGKQCQVLSHGLELAVLLAKRGCPEWGCLTEKSSYRAREASGAHRPEKWEKIKIPLPAPALEIGEKLPKITKIVFSEYSSPSLGHFPHFEGSAQGGEFCNFSPFFGRFWPGAFPASVRGRTNRNTL